MKRKISVLFSMLALAAILGYVAFQVFSNLTQQIKTVDAVEVTVEDKISVSGWVIREQIPVIAGQTGQAEYLIPDGDKVSKGQKLAVFFAGTDAMDSYHEASALEEELAAAEYAYSVITGGTDSVKMDQLIAKKIAGINDGLEEGNISRMRSDYSALQQLMASRSGTETDRALFEEQIMQLKQQLSEQKQRYDSGSNSVKAPESGYFFTGTDGYEQTLDARRVDDLTPEELNAVQRSEDSDALGTVTTGFCWYYAAVLPEKDAEKLQAKDQVEVYFPELSRNALTMELYRLDFDDHGQAILILKSSNMNREYLTARDLDADLVVGVYSGLKVPTAALRQQDGKWGVFVLESSIANFKPIQWSYQTDSYFLVPCAKDAKSGLFRYDRVIIQGKELAKEKVTELK